jgi:hypothetical protein
VYKYISIAKWTVCNYVVYSTYIKDGEPDDSPFLICARVCTVLQLDDSTKYVVLISSQDTGAGTPGQQGHSKKVLHSTYKS